MKMKATGSPRVFSQVLIIKLNIHRHVHMYCIHYITGQMALKTLDGRMGSCVKYIVCIILRGAVEARGWGQEFLL
jgi:hypothetical protein